jgi:hypothetical protein
MPPGLSKNMITYARLYADDQGESHFEDIEIDLALTEYAPPAPPLRDLHSLKQLSLVL